MRKIATFLVRQITRYHFGASKLNFAFQISNFVSLILLVLGDFGLDLRLRWIAVIYGGIFLSGFFFIWGLEQLGAWQIEKRQLFNMSQRDLYCDQIEYLSLKIAEANTMTPEERQKELARIEQKLFGDSE